MTPLKNDAHLVTYVIILQWFVFLSRQLIPLEKIFHSWKSIKSFPSLGVRKICKQLFFSRSVSRFVAVRYYQPDWRHSKWASIKLRWWRSFCALRETATNFYLRTASKTFWRMASPVRSSTRQTKAEGWVNQPIDEKPMKFRGSPRNQTNLSEFKLAQIFLGLFSFRKFFCCCSE